MSTEPEQDEEPVEVDAPADLVLRIPSAIAAHQAGLADHAAGRVVALDDL